MVIFKKSRVSSKSLGLALEIITRGAWDNFSGCARIGGGIAYAKASGNGAAVIFEGLTRPDNMITDDAKKALSDALDRLIFYKGQAVAMRFGCYCVNGERFDSLAKAKNQINSDLNCGAIFA
jgi:hypothetical protein